MGRELQVMNGASWCNNCSYNWLSTKLFGFSLYALQFVFFIVFLACVPCSAVNHLGRLHLLNDVIFCSRIDRAYLLVIFPFFGNLRSHHIPDFLFFGGNLSHNYREREWPEFNAFRCTNWITKLFFKHIFWFSNFHIFIDRAHTSEFFLNN